jgi:hypothetical protein
MKQISLTRTAAALAVIVLVSSGMLIPGCGHESNQVTGPEAPYSIVPPPGTTSSLDNQAIGEPGVEAPAEGDESLLAEAAEYHRRDMAERLDLTVTEYTSVNPRGYYQFTNPWPDSWTSKTHTSCVATITPSTGVGRAYARSIPNTQTGATCGIRNAPPGMAVRWAAPTVTGWVIVKSPTRIAGSMANGGGANASVWVDVKEYYPDGRYKTTYTRQVYSLTRMGSFNQSIDNVGFQVQWKQNYMYVICVSAVAYARSGPVWSTGSYVDISPAELKKVLFGY